jgi:leucyl aminopeptidase
MIDLPDFLPLKVTQAAGKAGPRDIDALDHLIVLVPKKPKPALLRGLPGAALLGRLLKRTEAADKTFVTHHLDNRRGTAITVATTDCSDPFVNLTRVRKLFGESGAGQAAVVGGIVAGFEAEPAKTLFQAIVRVADAAAFPMPQFRQKPTTRPTRIKRLKLFAGTQRWPIDRWRAGARGNNIARWLTALPPNVLTAASYRAAARSLAQAHGLNYEFLGIDKLERRGAGAFLAVAQGNAERDAGIVHLSYRPTAGARSELALVGKGILFDTGGTNLKPFQNMLEMHTDMQGSAVALGTAVELASQSVPFGFDVWLAVTENRISATAYKSQDVVTAANGTRIQVIHTDAEGRMVLADTLTLAAGPKPALIIDYATLTGSCIAALTTRYSGAFSNRGGSVRDLLSAGMQSGERIWPFPLDDDYDEPLKSDIADVKQCAVEGAGDHIFAARFLRRFVPDEVAWVHLDLSAGTHKGGLGAIPSDITGFGVVYTLTLLAGRSPADLASSWT